MYLNSEGTLFHGMSLELCYENSVHVDGNQMALGKTKNLGWDRKVFSFLCSTGEYVTVYSFPDSRTNSRRIQKLSVFIA